MTDPLDVGRAGGGGFVLDVSGATTTRGNEASAREEGEGTGGGDDVECEHWRGL